MAVPRSIDDFLEAARGRRRENEQCWPRERCCYRWKNLIIFVSLGIAFSSDATDILSLNYVLADPDFLNSILSNDDQKASSLAAAVFIGMLVGTLFLGALGDCYGRRPVILAGLAINCVASVCSGMLSTGVVSLGLFRLLAGFGIGATTPPLYTLCGELSPPSERGFWVTCLGWFWMVGSIYVAMVAWLLLGQWKLSWRLFLLVSTVPSAVGWSLIYYNVPESPRFLAVQGKHEEANVALRRIAESMQYEGDSLTPKELQELYPQLDSQQYPSSSTTSVLLISSLKDFVASLRQLYAPSLRGTTFLLKILWFSIMYAAYGIGTWISTLFVQMHLHKVYQDTLLYTLSGAVGMLLAALLVDRIRRIWLLTGGFLSAAVSLLSIAYIVVVSNNTTDSPDTLSMVSRLWIVVASCLYHVSMAFALDSNATVSAEQLPTMVRATGMGVCGASGKLAAVIAQWVNGGLIAEPAMLVGTTAIVLLIGSTMCAFLPSDRTGKPLVDHVARLLSPMGLEQETTSLLQQLHNNKNYGNA